MRAPPQIFPIASIAEPSFHRDHLTACEAHACGKAIITGEHAVVYGASAVAMPVRSLGLTLNLIPDDHERPMQFRLGGKAIPSHVADVVNDGLSLLGISEPLNAKIEGVSRLPIGAGLGSSASLCIATLRILTKARGLTCSSETLARMGNQLERRFHGNPSGLDTAVVAFEQVIEFQRTANQVRIEPVTSKRTPWTFVLVDSGIRVSTLDMIKLAKPFFHGPQGDRRLARFDQASLQVVSGLKAGNIQQVAESMDLTGSLLKEAGVVTSKLLEIIAACRQVGALAAKTTGAGGGGAVLALLDPTRRQEQLSSLRTLFGAGSVFSVEI